MARSSGVVVVPRHRDGKAVGQPIGHAVRGGSCSAGGKVSAGIAAYGHVESVVVGIEGKLSQGIVGIEVGSPIARGVGRVVGDVVDGTGRGFGIVDHVAVGEPRIIRRIVAVAVSEVGEPSGGPNRGIILVDGDIRVEPSAARSVAVIDVHNEQVITTQTREGLGEAHLKLRPLERKPLYITVACCLDYKPRHEHYRENTSTGDAGVGILDVR